jgi:ribosome biogenesis GTPase A
MRAFNSDSYKNEKWLYDTPGVIFREQVKTNTLILILILIYLFSMLDD